MMLRWFWNILFFFLIKIVVTEKTSKIKRLLTIIKNLNSFFNSSVFWTSVLSCWTHEPFWYWRRCCGCRGSIKSWHGCKGLCGSKTIFFTFRFFSLYCKYSSNVFVPDIRLFIILMFISKSNWHWPEIIRRP